MQRVQWKESYKTGIRIIDEDHQMLFHTVNALIDEVSANSGNNEIASTISALRQYVDSHFDREEKLLEKSEYEELENHKAMHRKLREKVLGIENLYQTDPEILNIEAICHFFSEWLIHHILYTDMTYVSYLKPQDSDDHASFEELTVKVPIGTGYLVNALANELENSRECEKDIKAILGKHSTSQVDLYQSGSLEQFYKPT